MALGTPILQRATSLFLDIIHIFPLQGTFMAGTWRVLISSASSGTPLKGRR